MASSYYLAPSLSILVGEVNRRWQVGWVRPGTSDGWIGDPDHSSRTSDHNPNARGSVNAVDVDIRGVDADALIKAALSDRRTNYVIHKRRIWNDDVGFAVRPYHGSNPHNTHVHISVKQAAWAEQDRAPWGLVTASEGEFMSLPVTKDSSKDDIRYWQGVLIELGQDLGSTGADGDYGRLTAAAVVAVVGTGGGYDGTYISGTVAKNLHREWFRRLAPAPSAPIPAGTVDVEAIKKLVAADIGASLVAALARI